MDPENHHDPDHSRKSNKKHVKATLAVPSKRNHVTYASISTGRFNGSSRCTRHNYTNEKPLLNLLSTFTKADWKP